MLARLRPKTTKTTSVLSYSIFLQLNQIQLISLSNIRNSISCYSFFEIHNFLLSLSFFFVHSSIYLLVFPPLLITWSPWANSITLLWCNLRSIPSISILSVRTSGNPRKRGKLIQTPAIMIEHGSCCGVLYTLVPLVFHSPVFFKGILFPLTEDF
jgi:hypothetical protein